MRAFVTRKRNVQQRTCGFQFGILTSKTHASPPPSPPHTIRHTRTTHATSTSMNIPEYTNRHKHKHRLYMYIYVYIYPHTHTGGARTRMPRARAWILVAARLALLRLRATALRACLPLATFWMAVAAACSSISTGSREETPPGALLVDSMSDRPG